MSLPEQRQFSFVQAFIPSVRVGSLGGTKKSLVLPSCHPFVMHERDDSPAPRVVRRERATRTEVQPFHCARHLGIFEGMALVPAVAGVSNVVLSS